MSTTDTHTTTAAPPAEWLEGIAAVLTATDRLSALEVAGGLAALGIPVLPTIPGGKDPLLSARHIDGINSNTGEVVGVSCPACNEWHLRPTRDHGATTDPETIGRYWGAHPEAGVGMKNHPRLIRGDGDHETREELKRSREAIGYGQPFGVPDPFEASTPGGTYRRRYLHWIPEGVPSAGGGTGVHGVSWYGNSGYVVIMGKHPTGHEYPRFYGTITELPETVALALARRVITDGGQGGAPAASSASVRQFLETYTGTTDPRRLEYRQRAINSAAVGSRHLTAAGQLVIGFREALAGYYPARVLVEIIAQGLRATGWDDARFEAEWDDLQGWALGQIAHLTPETARAEIGRRVAELAAGALVARAEEYPPELTGEETEPPTAAEVDRQIAEYERLERERIARERGTTSNLPGNDPETDTGQEMTRAERVLAHVRKGSGVLDKPRSTWTVRGYLPANGWGVGYGPPGGGKSFHTLSLALELARGGRWAGQDIEDPVKVLYVIAERPAVIADRQEAWVKFHGVPIPETFHEIVWAPQLHHGEDASTLCEVVRELGIKFVCIDTLAQCTLGMEENSSHGVGALIESLNMLVQATEGGVVHVVHHTGKDPTKGLRGSSAILGAADYTYEIGGEASAIRVTVPKLNAGPEPLPEWYRLEAVPLPALVTDPDHPRSGAVLVAATGRDIGGSRIHELLEAMIRDGFEETGVSRKDVEGLLGVEKSTAGAVVKAGKESGWLTSSGRGSSVRYYLTPAGVAQINGEPHPTLWEEPTTDPETAPVVDGLPDTEAEPE